VIVLVTNRDDLTADWLIVELQRRGASFVRFNTEDYPQRSRIHWRPDSATLTVNRTEIPVEDITAAWFRRPVAPRVLPGLAPDEQNWAIRETTAALDGFWGTLDTHWVSRPDAIRAADSKPKQLAAATRLGLDIPDTEITQDPGTVIALWERSPHGVICKPLRDGRVRGSGRSLLFATPIRPDDLEDGLDEPHLFQGFVAKRYDVRVTIIGERVFATRIDARNDPDGAVDWRRASPVNLQYSPELLPDDVADHCRQLVSDFGLEFGALDLARRTDGGYTFFELNPNGQWAFVEQRTGQPLRSTLAELLTTSR
jgi:hypothetical protein